MRTFQPDFTQFQRILRREKPDRPVLFELFLNNELYETFTGHPLRAQGLLHRSLWVADAFAKAGYDYASGYASDLRFPTAEHARQQTYSLNEGGLIHDEKSFLSYPWPDPTAYSSEHLRQLEDALPDGMQLMAMGPCGLLENAIALTGYETLCILRYEEPAVFQALFDRIGQILYTYYEVAAQAPCVGMIMINDDWGFNTQTFLSTDDMRTYVFPWQKKLVELAHRHGKPVLLHSCGNLDAVMDDIIAMGFDAKHSYEDKITPVEDAYARWGDRIAILGGIDVDFLVRKTPNEIRKRADALLDMTQSKGYALGSGNSIPPYIPQAHYRTMIEAAWDRR